MFFLFFLLSISRTDFTIATETDGLGFVYENIIPNNQQGDSDYFNLKVEAGSRQTLQTKIINKTKEPITIMITLGNAGTTPEGTINYLSEEKMEKKLYLTDIASVPKEITLEGLEEKILEIKLNVPENGFEGIIIGGVDLEKKSETELNIKESGVNNKYSYLFSISLTEKEVALKINLESQSGKYDVKTNLFTTDIVNSSDFLVKNLILEQTVTLEDSDKVIFSNSRKNLKIAPNSTLNNTEQLTELDSGDYKVYTKAIIEKDIWEWEHTFSVSEKEKQVQQSSPATEKLETSFKFPIIVLLGSVILLTIIILFYLSIL